MEGVPLVELHAGLVEGVDPQSAGGNAAGELEEIEQFAQFLVIQLAHIDGDDRHIAVHVGVQRADKGLGIHKIQGFALQIVQSVQIFQIAADGMLLGGRIEADHGFKHIPLTLLDQLPHGMKSNVGIENEKSGFIPDAEWKMRRFGEPWQQGESIISGIGQGYILTTPIQLATMISRIANGGYEVTPTFVKRNKNDKLELRKLDVPQQGLDVVKQGMYDVINSFGGTAYSARFDFMGQKMAGKTGTTQVRRISMKERQSGVLKQEDLPWKYRNHALFVGYAPHDNPKYGVAVLIEHGKTGTAAAHLGGRILRKALELDATDQPVE